MAPFSSSFSFPYVLSSCRRGKRYSWLKLNGRFLNAFALLFMMLWSPLHAAVSLSFPTTPVSLGYTLTSNYLAGVVAGIENDTEAAAIFFREALRRLPTNQDLIERAFVASLANGNILEAVQLAEKLIGPALPSDVARADKKEKNSSTPSKALRKAEPHTISDIPETSTETKEAKKDTPPPPSSISTGSSTDSPSELSASQKALEPDNPKETGAKEAGADEKNHSLAYLTLGVHALKMKRFVKARQYFSYGLQARQRDVTYLLLTAWSQAGSGNIPKALDLVEELNEPNFAVFRDFHAALLASVGKKPDYAFKRMKTAYMAQKKVLRVVDAYARFQIANGEIANAEVTYENFRTIVPRQPLVLSALQTLKSTKTLPPLVKNIDEGAAEVLYSIGTLGGHRGDELAELIYMHLALYLRPDHDLALAALADIYERLRQEERALQVYQSFADNSPFRATAEVQSAVILEKLNRHKEAVEYLQKVIAVDKNNPEAFVALGTIHSQAKDYTAAAESYTQALALVPEPRQVDWSTFYFRGMAYERQKKWPEAEKDFQKALELYPNQPQVLNYLAYSWIEMGIHYNDAIKMLQSALEEAPQEAYIIDSLGWAYYKKGQCNEALSYLERAMNISAADPVLNDHLGDVLACVGRPLEARFQWNHARDLNPDPADLQRILNKIEHGLKEVSPPPPAPSSFLPSVGGAVQVTGLLEHDR